MSDRQRIHDLQKLLGNLPGMAYRCHDIPDWDMQYASEGSIALSGYTPDELIRGEPHWGQLIHADDRSRVWSSVQAAIRKDEPFEIRYRMRNRDGEIRSVWERGSVVGKEGERLLLEGFITDISVEVAQQEKLLQQNERLNIILESSPVGIVMLDSDSHILSANQAFASMLGFDIEEVLGRDIQEFVIAEDLQATALASRRNMSELPSQATPRVRCVHKRGHIVTCTLDVRIVDDSVDQSEFAICNFADQTYADEVESRLVVEQEQLAALERLSLLGEIMSGVAHEINQPLAAVSTYAHAGLRFLSADEPRIEKLSEVLTKLTAEISRAGTVVDRIREMAGRELSPYTRVDINRVLRTTLEMTAAEARSRNISIRLDLDPSLAPALGDPVQIQQAVTNLLRNAMESMTAVSLAYGDEIHIRTSMQDSDAIVIDVCDVGSGVSDSIAHKIFWPFSSRKTKSLGLGLAITQSIVEAHRGQLDFVTSRNEGSVFTITLPRMPEEEVDE